MKSQVIFCVLLVSLRLTSGYTDLTYCLGECLLCVETWGKDLYNGGKCATACEESKGKSADPKCVMFANNRKRSRTVMLSAPDCMESCKRCTKRLGLKSVDNLTCFFTCVVQHELPEAC